VVRATHAHLAGSNAIVRGGDPHKWRSRAEAASEGAPPTTLRPCAPKTSSRELSTTSHTAESRVPGMFRSLERRAAKDRRNAAAVSVEEGASRSAATRRSPRTSTKCAGSASSDGCSARAKQMSARSIGVSEVVRRERGLDASRGVRFSKEPRCPTWPGCPAADDRPERSRACRARRAARGVRPLDCAGRGQPITRVWRRGGRCASSPRERQSRPRRGRAARSGPPGRAATAPRW
jgi:hypothetical protein